MLSYLQRPDRGRHEGGRQLYSGGTMTTLRPWPLRLRNREGIAPAPSGAILDGRSRKPRSPLAAVCIQEPLLAPPEPKPLGKQARRSRNRRRSRSRPSRPRFQVLRRTQEEAAPAPAKPCLTHRPGSTWSQPRRPRGPRPPGPLRGSRRPARRWSGEPRRGQPW